MKLKNYSKYDIKPGRLVINIKTKKPVKILPNGKGYCLYNDQDKRKTVLFAEIDKACKGRRKLSKQDIVSIHELTKTNAMRVKEIANMFNTCRSTVSKIKNNQTFKSITQ